jgi:hypothetical protein
LYKELPWRLKCGEPKIMVSSFFVHIHIMRDIDLVHFIDGEPVICLNIRGGTTPRRILISLVSLLRSIVTVSSDAVAIDCVASDWLPTTLSPKPH